MNNARDVAKILTEQQVKFEIVGANMMFKGFSSFFDQAPNSCTFINEIDSNVLEILKISVADVFIVNRQPSFINQSKTFVIVENPRKIFFDLVRAVFGEAPLAETYIHPTAIVSPKAKIGNKVFIGEYCVIGECEVGDCSRIKSFTKVHDGSVIGCHVEIHEHCNIGGIGFGHVWEGSEYVNQPHIGSLRIEDFVEIFPYTNVDRGTLGNTRVGRGTKIDHFCHIGHNSQIDENNLIMCNSTLLGRADLGTKNIVGAGTMFREGTKIGSENFFGMRSSVMKSVQHNEIWYGSPAKLQQKK